ncbi:MAG: MaoC family dehydratase [Planktomarina sp.]|nr:MaoC family dehydratase [Planktomarina sp.]
MKTNSGLFFENFSVGQVMNHAVPRTIGTGERALYHALYPSRHALFSSDVFAQSCGLPSSPIDDLAAFHVIFGKSVPDISLNAVANLGYAEAQWILPVYPGDTLNSRSTIIGLKQNSNGKTGIVWVRTEGFNQSKKKVMEFVRWVMVRKRNLALPAPKAVIPKLKNFVLSKDLVLPNGFNFNSYNYDLAGSSYNFGDYTIGEIIDHVDGITVSEAEHMMATRMWQNTAKVHFNTQARPDGMRLIYGGHVISMARALSFNGLGNAQMIVAINSGAHVNPCFAGDTIYAWSEVVDCADTSEPSVGALRLRLVATKGEAGVLKSEDGRYHDDVLLDLDYWVFIPK